MALSLVACGAKKEEAPAKTDAPAASTETTEKEGPSFALVVTGFIGETGCEDLILAGLEKFCGEHGGSVNVIELNYDTSLYENAVTEACKHGEYDVILAGYFDLAESVAKAAEAYPDQKIIIYDAEMDYSDGKYPNVKSLLEMQNEGSFLAGALAALLTTKSDVEGINADKVVGWVGALENPVLNDYLIGYIQGVKYVDPSVEVLYSWVGDFSNSAVAKELALTQYQRGADIVYACCAAAGVGVDEAAAEAGSYCVEVNVDVAMKMMESNPDVAVHVLTSVEKNYEVLILQLLEEYAAGTLEWGTTSYGTVANGGMKLSDNEVFRGIVPDDVYEEYAKIQQDLIDGKIVVDSAVGTPAELVDGWKAQASGS
jgi:basic membrane protein A